MPNKFPIPSPKILVLLSGIILIFVFFIVKWKPLASNLSAVTASESTPSALLAAQEINKQARLLFFGDMMLDRNVKKQIEANGADYLFEKLFGSGGINIANYDIISVNLEGPFADKRRTTTKSIAFRFDPSLIPVLKKFGFSLFDNANNHSYDMGAAGFEESKNNLRSAGLNFFGSQYKIDGDSIVIKRVGDFNFAFVGINDTNSPVDIDKAKGLIIKAKVDADFVIMNIHWGAEYQEISNQRQRSLAHEFIDAGADVIVGHHPHVIEEMEIYKNRPIFYSLGNFIFDQYFSIPTQQGFAIGLTLARADQKKIISFEILPFKGVRSQIFLMDENEKLVWFKDWVAKSRLGDYNFDGDKLSL